MTEKVHGVTLRDFRAEPLQVLSFGGGTQSSAMLILIEMGKLPKPDIVIFSDTGSEEDFTLKHVHEVAKPFVESMGIPFLVVKHEMALHDYFAKNRTIPMIGNRSCTSQFKIGPIRRAMREIVGNKRKHILATCWLGITTDEQSRRVDESDVQWCNTSYPLLDDYRMSRNCCIDLLEIHGWEVQKSGCWLCPYAGPRHWPKLKARRPDLFAKAVEMEEAVFQRRREENEVIKRDGGRTKDVEFIKFNRGGIPLRVIQEMKSLWSYTDDEEPDDFSCDSGAGCFI